MNFRKLLNLPTKSQKALIQDGINRLRQLAEECSKTHMKREYELQTEQNTICPKCMNTDIVDKIIRTQGSGNVSGSLVLGSGSILGSSSSDTNAVNNCNNCGHQWKKYILHYRSYNDIIVEWLNNICNYNYDDERDSNMLYLIKDIPAESLYAEFKRLEHNCYYYTQSNLKLKYLRKKYNSIYGTI